MLFRYHGQGRRGGGFRRGPFEAQWSGSPGERGGRRRTFDSGELRLVLLKLIADQPRHGYDLIREVESLSGGAYAPSPGVIYPTLTLLADMSLIDEEKDEGARKLFAVTPRGEAHLAEREGEVAALLGRLAELAERRGKTEGGPVRRAMMNLRQVLQQRLTAGEVSPDTLHEVAAILDAAAQQIERLQERRS